MRIISDLHIHSKYSRAVSQEMVLENIALWAGKKGIQIMGTGDFTHPQWFNEIKTKLEPAENGLYKLKSEARSTKSETRFMLTTEISSIYSKNGKVRKIHNLVFAPSIEAVEKINTKLGWIGNLKSDGRPILGLDSKELLKIILDIDDRCVLVPAHCLLPDTIIHTKDDLLKPIQNIRKGDLVITHKNTWHRVTEVFKRPYNGKIYHIKPRNFSLGLTTTSEHPFYAIKTHKNCHWSNGICKPSHINLNECKNKYFKDYKPEWIPAKKLERGDVLIYPRFLNVFQNHREINLEEITKESGTEVNSSQGLIVPIGNRITQIKQFISIDKNFCKLAGYYLAEGYTNSRDLIGFAFSNKEKNYIEEVIDLMKKVFGFDKEPKLKINKSGGVEILFYSKILLKTFQQLFYSSNTIQNASTKSLPTWTLGLPLDLQVELFKCWWRGDAGYTASRLLMNQMKIILLRLGIVPSIYVDKRDGHNSRPKHFIEGRKINARYNMYSLNRLSFYEDKFNLLKEPEFAKVAKYNKGDKYGWIDNNYIYLPIYDIEIKNYRGEVYNLEVEEDNSYVCEFTTIHNCWTPWFSIFGSMSGFDSIEECFEELSPHIFAIETGLSCYDKETEVLTDNGWKKFDQVQYKDKICSLNLKNKEIEFQNPTKIHTYDYKGKMYRLKTKRVDLLVTPNHNLLVSGCDFRKPPKFALKTAETLFNKSKRFKKDGVWIGTNPKYFILPDVKIKHGSGHYSGYRLKKEKKFPIKPWLKFFGFWIAEGWVSEGKNGDYGVYLANQDSALLSEMKQIFEGFGYDVYWDKKVNHTLRVRDYQLFHYLKKFGKCSDKFIPPEIKSLSKELLEIFLDYYIKGDGHIYGRDGKGLSATTTSIRLRDDLQEIALKVGMSAYCKLHNKKGTPFRSPSYKYKKIYKQRNDSWVIFFIRKNLHTVLPSIIKKHNYIESWVDFGGPVFCVTVPNQVIYIRRNGIPVWCGNSDPAMNWRLTGLDKISLISNSDSHSLQKIGREANVFECELSYGAIIDAIKNRDPKKFLYTIEFFPEEGKYHYDGHRVCNVSMSPQETKKNSGLCPVCHKGVTIGVMNRVDKLADMVAGEGGEGRVPFLNLIPLDEIIADILGVGVSSKAVKKEYEELIKNIGTEFRVLLESSYEELSKATSSAIAKGIISVRERKVELIPGYDGEYGKIKIINGNKKKNDGHQPKLFSTN